MAPYNPKHARKLPTEDELARLEGAPTQAEIAERAAAIRETWQHMSAIELASHDSPLHPHAARNTEPGIRIIDSSKIRR